MYIKCTRILFIVEGGLDRLVSNSVNDHGSNVPNLHVQFKCDYTCPRYFFTCPDDPCYIYNNKEFNMFLYITVHGMRYCL